MNLLNNNYYISGFFILLIHLFLLAWQVEHQHWYLVDSYEYVEASENMKINGSWYSKSISEPYDPGHHTRRTPLYPFLLMLSSFLIDSPVFVAVWQIALSLFNIFLMWRLIKKFSNMDDKKIILLSLPFLIFLPAQYIYANLIMTEILFQSTLMLMFWFSIRALEEKKMRFYWGISVFLILAMATKPVMYLFFIPFLVLMFFQAWIQKKPLLIAIGMLPFFYVLGYQAINHHRTGYYHFSSVQSLNLLQLTAYNLLINRVGEEEAVKITDDIHARALAAPSFAEGQQLMQDECLEIVWQYKGYYFQYHIKGMVNFFLDPGRFDLHHVGGIQEVGAGAGLSRAFSEGGYTGIFKYLEKQPIGLLIFLLLVVVGNALRAIGFVAFLFFRKIPIGARLFLMVLVGYVAAVTGPYGASRFSLPVNLLLIMAATLSIHQFLPKSKRQ